MKSLGPILTIISLIASIAGAESQKINFHCDSTPSRSRYHFSENEAGKLDLQISHSHLTTIPIVADFSLSDLASATNAGETAMNMGKEINITFTPDQCKIAWGKNRSVRCYNNKPAKIGSVEVDSFYFLYYETKTIMSLGANANDPEDLLLSINESHARLAYVIDGTTYKMYMPYSLSECSLGTPPTRLAVPQGEAI